MNAIRLRALELTLQTQWTPILKLRQMGQPVDEFSSLMPGHGGSRFPVAPILLIALGVVFLLNNLEIFELRRMLRYWPVMLIALGLYMLYMRMTASSSGLNSEGKHERP